jgi:hypothetical protein
MRQLMDSSRRSFLVAVGTAMVATALDEPDAASRDEPAAETTFRSMVLAELTLIVELWHEVRAGGLPVDPARVTDVAGGLRALHDQADGSGERQALERLLARTGQLLDPVRTRALHEKPGEIHPR